MCVIGVAVGDIVAAVQLASNIYKTFSAFQHRDGIQSLQQEVVSLKSTLTALQQHIPTDREALLDDISLVEETVSDFRITMEQAMAALRKHENTRYIRGDHMRIGELRKDSSLCRSKLYLWLDMQKRPYNEYSECVWIIGILSYENTGYIRGGYMRIEEVGKDSSKCQSKLCLWLDMRARPYENFGDVKMVEVYTGDDSFALMPYESLMESISTADSLALTAFLSCEWTLNENMDLDTASLGTTYEGLMEIIPILDFWASMASLSCEWTWNGNMDLDTASHRTTYEGPIESVPTLDSWASMAFLSFEWTWIWIMDLETASRRFLEACLRQQIVSSSTFHSLFRRINAVLQLNAPKTLLLLSPLLFAHSTAAMAADYDSVHDSDSWMPALRCRQVDLISLWTHPFTNPPLLKQAADPTSLLLATLLGTSTIALVAQAGRNDVFQTRIIGFCALVGAIAAAVMEAGLRDFIFGYLFWGCVVGVKASWIAHRVWPGGMGTEKRQVEAGQADSRKGGS